MDRLNRMLRSYIKPEDLAKLIQVEMNDPARTSNLRQLKPVYDRVLVDAPCTNDRLSLFADKNNIFSKQRSDERAAISKLQTELLTYTLKFSYFVSQLYSSMLFFFFPQI